MESDGGIRHSIALDQEQLEEHLYRHFLFKILLNFLLIDLAITWSIVASIITSRRHALVSKIESFCNGMFLDEKLGMSSQLKC